MDESAGRQFFFCIEIEAARCYKNLPEGCARAHSLIKINIEQFEKSMYVEKCI